MEFINYITNKLSKATKPQEDALWSKTTISSKELYFFNKGIQELGLDTYVIARGDKKNYEVDGYKFEFGINEFTFDSYTKVETPSGLTFDIKDPKYKNQYRMELRFYVGE